MRDDLYNYRGLEIFWDGHASIRAVDDGFTVAVDPFSEVSPDFQADIVLVTHEDEGHFDRDKLDDLCGSGTVLVLPESMKEVDVPCMDVEYLKEGEVVDIYNVEVEATPMYNSHHERDEGVGYRFVMDGRSIYVAGDISLMDEAAELEGRVDVAFLPVEGSFTMDVEEAIKMAVRIKPEAVVPYHYGEPFFTNREIDLRGLKAELEDRNIKCEILAGLD